MLIPGCHVGEDGEQLTEITGLQVQGNGWGPGVSICHRIWPATQAAFLATHLHTHHCMMGSHTGWHTHDNPYNDIIVIMDIMFCFKLVSCMCIGCAVYNTREKQTKTKYVSTFHTHIFGCKELLKYISNNISPSAPLLSTAKITVEFLWGLVSSD